MRLFSSPKTNKIDWLDLACYALYDFEQPSEGTSNYYLAHFSFDLIKEYCDQRGRSNYERTFAGNLCAKKIRRSDMSFRYRSSDYHLLIPKDSRIGQHLQGVWQSINPEGYHNPKKWDGLFDLSNEKCELSNQYVDKNQTEKLPPVMVPPLPKGVNDLFKGELWDKGFFSENEPPNKKRRLSEDEYSLGELPNPVDVLPDDVFPDQDQGSAINW